MKVQGTTDGGAIHSCLALIFLGDVGDAVFVPYFVICDDLGDLSGRLAREPHIQFFGGVISRSCDGPGGRGTSKGSSRYVFLSFRHHTVCRTRNNSKLRAVGR